MRYAAESVDYERVCGGPVVSGKESSLGECQYSAINILDPRAKLSEILLFISQIEI